MRVEEEAAAPEAATELRVFMVPALAVFFKAPLEQTVPLEQLGLFGGQIGLFLHLM
jgi:hypothetical protein